MLESCVYIRFLRFWLMQLRVRSCLLLVMLTRLKVKIDCLLQLACLTLDTKQCFVLFRILGWYFDGNKNECLVNKYAYIHANGWHVDSARSWCQWSVWSLAWMPCCIITFKTSSLLWWASGKLSIYIYSRK